MVESIPQTNPGWRSLVVMLLHGNDRAQYHLSHNQQRFSYNESLVRLCDRYPTVAEEVTAWVEQEVQA